MQQRKELDGKQVYRMNQKSMITEMAPTPF